MLPRPPAAAADAPPGSRGYRPWGRELRRLPSASGRPDSSATFAPSRASSASRTASRYASASDAPAPPALPPSSSPAAGSPSAATIRSRTAEPDAQRTASPGAAASGSAPDRPSASRSAPPPPPGPAARRPPASSGAGPRRPGRPAAPGPPTARSSRPADASAPPSAARFRAAPSVTDARAASPPRNASSPWSSRPFTASALRPCRSRTASPAGPTTRRTPRRPAAAPPPPRTAQLHPTTLPLLRRLQHAPPPSPPPPSPAPAPPPGPLVRRGAQPGHRPATSPASAGRSAGELRPGSACTARPAPARPRSRPAGRSSRPGPRADQHPHRLAPAPANGGLPVRITASIAPRPNTSLRASTLPTAPAACSGGMYAGVPSTLPACVNEPSESRRLDRSASPPPSPRGRPASAGRRRQHLGQSPVHDLHLAEAAHHHVGRLEVAVNDAVGVGVGHRLADLLEHRHETPAIRRRVGRCSQQHVQGAAP